MDENHRHKDGNPQDRTELTLLYLIVTRPAEANKAGSIGRTDRRPGS